MRELKRWSSEKSAWERKLGDLFKLGIDRLTLIELALLESASVNAASARPAVSLRVGLHWTSYGTDAYASSRYATTLRTTIAERGFWCGHLEVEWVHDWRTGLVL